jgi:hypothetical protein
LLRVISALALLAQTLFPTAPPGVGRTDAYARAAGNEKRLAVAIGRKLFMTEWPAQVLNVYADGIDKHSVAGLHLSGVHFHHGLTREEFISEIASLVQKTFAASSVDEVDVWTTVPLRVGKDIIVAGDLAKPTSRTVFTLSVHRGEPGASFIRRMRQGDGVYWDQDWALANLK